MNRVGFLKTVRHVFISLVEFLKTVRDVFRNSCYFIKNLRGFFMNMGELVKCACVVFIKTLIFIKYRRKLKETTKKSDR